MRVLVANHSLSLGGGQLYLTELLKQMRALAPLEVFILSETGGRLARDLEQDGIDVNVCGSAPADGPHYEAWLRMQVGAAALFDPDVVLANTAGCFWGVDLASRLDVPAVWAIHESFAPELFLRHYFGASVDSWTRDRFYFAFGYASSVVFEAEATKRIFSELIPAGRSRVIDYGIDLKEIREFRDSVHRQDLRERLGISRRDLVLVCIGSYEPRKAQGLLAYAFDQVASEHPDARLFLIGDSPGAFSEALASMIGGLQHTSQIRTVAMTSSIYDWYLASDAFVLASSVESLSRAMLEAMAFGSVPLVSDVFGASSVVEDGVNGFLFDPYSVSSVSRALQRLMRLESNELTEFSRRARATVDPSRASSNYGAEYLEMIKKLTDRTVSA